MWQMLSLQLSFAYHCIHQEKGLVERLRCLWIVCDNEMKRTKKTVTFTNVVIGYQINVLYV